MTLPAGSAARREPGAKPSVKARNTAAARNRLAVGGGTADTLFMLPSPGLRKLWLSGQSEPTLLHRGFVAPRSDRCEAPKVLLQAEAVCFEAAFARRLGLVQQGALFGSQQPGGDRFLDHR